MPEQPPEQLVAMLERLGLATAAQVGRMGRRVRRLARDLPGLESVWVDALAQARVLTPLQAAEINAGRAQSLRVGPYVLCERLPQPSYVACYRARNVESQEPARLAVVENPGARAEVILRELESLVGCSDRDSRRVDAAAKQNANPPPHVPRLQSLITHVGADGDRIFAAAAWREGRTATQWMVHHGRFPPEVVLEIARAMIASLAELERAGICHGDLSASSVVLSNDGDVALLLPGLRGILRPEEGYTYVDLLPEAFDSLAPERIAAGTPPNVQSDIYACGCVWWHLLCGRAPLGGGNSLEKLRAAQQGEVCDVRRYAPDVPATLASAIGACMEREPSRRPESMARLTAMLGPPTRGGKEALADCLARAGRPAVRWTTTVRSIRRSNRTPLWVAGAVCCLAAAVAMFWHGWHGLSGVGKERATAAAEQGENLPSPFGRGAGGEGSRAMGRGNDRTPTPNALTLTLSQRERGPTTQSDEAAVVPATYQRVEPKPPDLVIPADKPLCTTSLDLRAGQCVRGPTGKRAIVLVAGEGLLVDKENIRFENIDFVWREAAAENDAKPLKPAVVRLLASEAEFRGCSFGREIISDVPISAIRWVHPPRAEITETSLPNGRLRLTDCMLYRVGAGLDCRTVGALAIELRNTLHLDAGPLVRLDHCPEADEPVSIALGQVTLRGGGPLLECLVPRGESQPGEIAVLATACAFLPKPNTPLIRITGVEMPERLPGSVRWSGQGSLVTPATPMIAWQGPDGRQQPLDESSLSIAGLVRSEVGFAGQPTADPAASRIMRWQAPLQSADPPGIEPGAIPHASFITNAR